MSYATLTESKDQSDRATQSQCASDEQANGNCDGDWGADVKTGNLHPAYIDALTTRIRKRLEAGTGETFSFRWLSEAYTTGGYDEI